MTTHHLPHPLAESRQLPAIFFSFLQTCPLVVFYLFIFSDRLFEGGPLTIHWSNWQKIDPISSKPAFSELISWHLDCARTWKYTGLSESRSRRGRTVSPFSFLFPEVYLSVGNPRKVHCDRSFFVKWSHGAVTVTERGSGRSHLIRQQTKTQYLQCSAT